MKVVGYQTSPVLLNLKHNLEDTIHKIREAKERGAQLVVFPELALTGYFVGKRYHEVALRMDSPEIKALAEASKGTAAVIGFIEETPAMNFYNSAIVLVDGEIQYAYRKLNLPNYGVFEERKYFASGKQVPVFKLHDFTIAVFVCNDLWHPSLPYLGVVQKADVFVSIFNSSQGSMGSEFSNIESWGIINKFYSRIFGIYNICVNRVGEERWQERTSILAAETASIALGEAPFTPLQEEVFHFWGGSEIINPFGKPMVKAPLYEEHAISTTLSRDVLRQKKILLPYLRDDDPYFTHRELHRILFDKRRFERP
ncbi:MAG: nitrilase-related carbon-nitrogen hydrolase [Deltaproteobacteria bacterium]|nr:nitrilase-related carbon-nitrogen hydrolase [Deltaproteobacteria bacterium]